VFYSTLVYITAGVFSFSSPVGKIFGWLQIFEAKVKLVWWVIPADIEWAW